MISVRLRVRLPGGHMKNDLKKKLKTILGRAADAAGICERRFGSVMTIVAFHRVNDTLPDDGLTCTAAKFEAFCRYFQEHFRVVGMSEQVAGARAGRDMSGTLSITFDDGYLDNYEVAAPILRKLKLPATFFVTTGFVGSSIVAPWDRGLPTPQGWMNWDQVRSLASQGFEIGCHSDTHLDIGEASVADVNDDLRVAQAKIKRELGIDARLFAYPFGGPQHISESSLQVVRELGFECCAACHGGTNAPVPNPYELNRIGIAEWFSNPYQFALELALGKA
jgi:peptidoglycan/xylan/chitin deacetylase (PgdA/CDA1 family)